MREQLKGAQEVVFHAFIIGVVVGRVLVLALEHLKVL